MSMVLVSTSIPLMAERARAPGVRTPGCERVEMTYEARTPSAEVRRGQNRGPTHGPEELMGNAENDQGGVLEAVLEGQGTSFTCRASGRREKAHLDDSLEVGHGDEVLGEDHLGQVSRVLVCLVNQVGQEALARDLPAIIGISIPIARTATVAILGRKREREGGLRNAELTSRWRTHMLTVSSNPSCSVTLIAARRASAVPQLPLPMTATFSVLPLPSMGSNLARKGAMAGEEPRRALGARRELVRESDSAGLACSKTEAAEVCVRGFMVSLPMALRRGEGGREDPGVERGDTGRLPGSEASWNPRGDGARVDGGESFVGVEALRIIEGVSTDISLGRRWSR